MGEANGYCRYFLEEEVAAVSSIRRNPIQNTEVTTPVVSGRDDVEFVRDVALFHPAGWIENAGFLRAWNHEPLVMAVSKKDEGRGSGIIRPFGNLECYEYHMLQLRFLGNTIVSCRYTLPAALLADADRHHDVVVARVEDAIARVVLEHAALRIDVVNADSKRPAWVGVERVDFAHHVRWEEGGGGADDSSDAKLREIIERRLDEPEANLAKRPGWRVLVLHGRGGSDPFLDIVFDYSHGLGDGTSGKIFHETLLRLLNTPPPTSAESQSPLANRILTIPPTAAPLPPAVEKLAKFPVSAKFALSTAWKELRAAKLLARDRSAGALGADPHDAVSDAVPRHHAAQAGPGGAEVLPSSC
ncbi:hypothetical protein EKO27_g11790 [Xylaria grammica]|uniref:Uncharacterized protein n=1 Tax=Xylaria grammica TaxID=363999 RepID=A0A439CMC5_9PEZI|nr:hypothetical protein EKO27_g11790 [Xylaria grammica]